MAPRVLVALILLASLDIETLVAGVREKSTLIRTPPRKSLSSPDVNEKKTDGRRALVHLQAFSFLFALAIVLQHRRLSLSAKQSTPVHVHNIRSEFMEFIRPELLDDDSPAGGYFLDGHCPPHPLGTMQAQFEARRSLLYPAAGNLLPWSSIRLSAYNACLTAFIWSITFMLETHDGLKLYVASFDLSKDEPSCTKCFFKLAITFVSKLSVVLQVAVAFFVLYFAKTRMRWLSRLKITIGKAQQSLEMVAFMSSGFLCGDDEPRRNARYSIHRWLTAAHFFNYYSVSASLARFNENDLRKVNLLTEAEAQRVSKAVGAGVIFDRRHLVEESEVRSPGFIFQSHLPLSLKAEQDLLDIQYSRDQAVAARDLCLWWVQVRLQAAIKEKLMDADKLKKMMGPLCQSRNFLDSVLTSYDERPPVYWVLLMRLMVDLWIAVTPFFAIDTMMAWNLLLVVGPMMFSFISTFMVDSLFKLTHQMWSPFGPERDDLNVDAVLVVTERTTFTNLSRGVESNLPSRLSEVWAKVNICDEKEKSDKVKDKDKDEQERNEEKEKEKGGKNKDQSDKVKDKNKFEEKEDEEKDNDKSGEEKDKSDKVKDLLPA